MTGLYRVVESGFTATEMPALTADENALRVTERLTSEEYVHLARLLDERQDAWLHLWDGAPDLESLRFFPNLRALMVTDLRLESWDGLRHVAASLEHLAMGDTTLKPISIAPMAELRRLRTLSLVGPVTHSEAIEALAGIEELTLRSVTLPDLSVLLAMKGLRSLSLLLGGTVELDMLTELQSLEELELWRIRGLRDVSVIGQLGRVRRLQLQSMSAVAELPSLGGCIELRRLALDTMRGITDLTPVAAAPRLEELLLIAMNQLTPESLRPLVGHPSLRRGVWGLGSVRKNVAAYDMLPLGDPPWGHPNRPA